MPSWKKVIISGSNAALNSLNVSTSLTASGIIYPTTDGTSGQVVITDGNGNLSFSNVENTTISIKNVSGGTILKGTPCYITGSGTSGNLAGVFPADASNPLRMPAGVIAGETLNDGDEGMGLINGFISGVNTSTFAAGDQVYVAVGGGYTNVAPTGSALVQKLGNVEKSHPSNGSGVINGPGAVRSVPNINPGYLWVGNSDWVATPIATSSIQNVVSASYALTASYTTAISGTDNYIPKFNGTSALENSLIYDNGTNVGIGTTSPSSKLDVYGTISLNGYDALKYNTAKQGLYAGHLAGNDTLRSNAFGIYALGSNTGTYSNGFGNNSLQNNTGANSNGFGYYALQNNTGISSNGFGSYALRNNTGIYSSGFGNSALRDNTGNYSNGFGNLTLLNNSGSNNTALGHEAGYESTSLIGSNNTFLGSNASYGTATNISNATAVGANVTLTDSDTVILGNGANVGIGTTSPSAKLDVNDSNSIGLNLKRTTNNNIGIRFENSGTNKSYLYGASDAYAFRYFYNSSEYLTISNIGNVGIGTSSPGAKLDVEGDVLIKAANLSNQENLDVDTGTEVVATVAIATYTAAFFDFVVKNGTNIRSGTVYACHDGTNVEYTETSTSDLGNTSDVTLSVDISSGNMRLLATTTSDNWIIKSLVRAI